MLPQKAAKLTPGKGDEPHENTHNGPDARSARNAQDIGLRQGISKQGLKNQSPQGKCCAHQGCQKYPGQADAPDNGFKHGVRFFDPRKGKNRSL
jgi:hypothetical protein